MKPKSQISTIGFSFNKSNTSTHVLEIIGSELFGSHNHVAIFVFIKIHGTIISNGVIKYGSLFLQDINYFYLHHFPK